MKALCCVCIMTFAILCSGKDKPSSSHVEVTSPFYIGTLLRLPGSGFSLIPATGGLNFGTSLNYRPATQLLVGLAARYRIIGGELVFSLPFLAAFQTFEGRSTYQDWRINYYGKEWGIELNYSEYTGYLIEGVPGPSGEPYYLLPGLKNIGAGVVVYYNFSPDSYSMGAAFDQRERQLSPGGSFFLLGSVRYQEIRSSVEIIPSGRQLNFGADGTLSRSSMKSIAGGIGYGYNFVLWDFFIAAAAAVEIGPQLIKYTLSTGDVDTSSFGLNGRLKVSTGFNGETILTGVNIYADGYTQGLRNTVVVNIGYGAQAFFGFRL